MTKAQTLFLPAFVGVVITCGVLFTIGLHSEVDTEGLLNFLIVRRLRAFRSQLKSCDEREEDGEFQCDL